MKSVSWKKVLAWTIASPFIVVASPLILAWVGIALFVRGTDWMLENL